MNAEDIKLERLYRYNEIDTTNVTSGEIIDGDYSYGVIRIKRIAEYERPLYFGLIILSNNWRDVGEYCSMYLEELIEEV